MKITAAHEIDDAPPSEAVPLIEANVRALVERLERELPSGELRPGR